MRHVTLETPTGSFFLAEDGAGRLCCGWVADEAPPGVLDADLRPDLRRRLEAWFAGGADDFADLPLPSGTIFQQRCWDACRRIPAGATITYAQLAAAAGGSPGAARAAGQSMRRNPLPVIIPCHRVVAAAGPGGFGGSDDPNDARLRRKMALLELETAGGAQLVR